MATSILSSLLSKARFRVTEQVSGQLMIPGSKIIRVNSRLSSIVPRHIKEDGSTIVDTRIIVCASCMVEIICPSIDDVEDVVNLMNSRDKLYTVYSKGLVFQNMMLNMSTARQSPEVLSAAPFLLQFQQQLLETTVPVVCEQPGDSDMIDQGIQTIQTATQSVSDLYTDVINRVNGVFGG